MMKLRITALTLCLSLVLGMALPCALAEDDGAPKLKSAQCALLGDMGSGRILFNIDAYSRPRAGKPYEDNDAAAGRRSDRGRNGFAPTTW